MEVLTNHTKHHLISAILANRIKSLILLEKQAIKVPNKVPMDAHDLAEFL